jgi:hypothetical protein
MDKVNEVRKRLELSLFDAKTPTLEEVLKQVAQRGVLRGPADWTFEGWRLYIDYAVTKTAEAFQLTEERRTLLNFRDAVKTLLTEAQRQAREKLESLYEAVTEGKYKIENGKLYTPDAWMYISKTMRVPIRRVSAKTYFPDILKLPRRQLMLLQAGWRASDEGGSNGRPYMATTQPWQLFAWAAARYGEIRIRVESVNLTQEGISVSISMVAGSWRQQWRKEEAIKMVIKSFQEGDATALLTMWLGDGKARWNRIGRFEVAIASKAPQKLGRAVGEYEAIVAKGRDIFALMAEAAGPYGSLLDVLRSHKWLYVKEAAARKRSVEIFREAVGNVQLEVSPEQVLSKLKFSLVSGNGGTLIAAFYASSIEEAVAAANALEKLNMKPNIAKMSNRKFMAYIGLNDIRRNKQLRKAAAQYLAEKAKNGTPRQREIARRIIERNPDFSL